MTACRAVRRDAYATVKQTAEYGRSGPADGSMRGHAYRLVDHDHVIVFVDHGHVMSDRFRLGTFLDDVEFNGLPRLQARRFGDVTAEYTSLAGLDQVRGFGS